MLKRKTPRSKHYLNYIRSLPCCLCGHPAEAHHMETAGVGMKGSDYLTIPLCRIHHNEYHNKGKKTFTDSHGLNPWRLMAKYMEAYVHNGQS